MQVQVIPDFFTSVSKLSRTDQKRVQKTISLVTQDYDGSGLRFHKINHPSDRIYSYSVNRDIRIIVHRKDKLSTLLYVDHHDAAYAWVGRRKFVAIDESIRIISVQETELEAAERTSIAANPIKAANPILASLGRMEDYKRELSSIHDDDDALEFIENLPLDEAAKSTLLEYVVEKSARRAIMPKHFVKVIDDDEELKEALKYPLDLWRVFLHPRQQEIVSQPTDSSRYITGGPGTGKTVCLVHRIKRVLQSLVEDQQVVLVTYKEHLSGYIKEMMQRMSVDFSRVTIVDVNEMSEANVINVTSDADEEDASKPSRDIAWKKNCFVISNGRVFYFDDRPIRFEHIFVDEYQDFTRQQLDIIHQLSNYVPFTICVDYSQAVYRPPRKMVTDLVDADEPNIVELSYCYRLNDKVVQSLKNVLLAAQVISNYAEGERFRFEIISREVRVIDSLQPAVIGRSPTLVDYGTESELHDRLADHVAFLLQSFCDDEIVVSRLFPGVDLIPGEPIGFGKELLPASVHKFYRYVYTLKGLEWKAGVIILDEPICSLLNLNRSVFARQVPEGLTGSKANVKRMINLLYVAISRFRDHLSICYPRKHSLIVESMFKLF